MGAALCVAEQAHLEGEHYAKGGVEELGRRPSPGGVLDDGEGSRRKDAVVVAKAAASEEGDATLGLDGDGDWGRGLERRGGDETLKTPSLVGTTMNVGAAPVADG